MSPCLVAARVALALNTVLVFVLPTSAAVAAGTEGSACHAQPGFGLVVHGGSLDVRENKAPQVEFVKRLLADARQRLRSGSAALDVVESVAAAMEDSGLFNAGKGANANAGGFVELDASIMDGRELRAGAIASMRHVKNPVTAARLVMDRSRHVFMVGDRGEDYVRDLGAQLVDEGYFRNSGRRVEPEPHGTVGAAALDRCGNLAAATSTGGYGAKIPGRVGDSPIVGAGVYANNAIGAFSSTGLGEYFIRYSVTKDVADRMQYGKERMTDAARTVIVEQLGALHAEAALIGIDRTGAVMMVYNEAGLVRGFTTHTIEPQAAAYEGTLGTAYGAHTE